MGPDLVVQNGGRTNMPLEPRSRVGALVVSLAKATFEKGIVELIRILHG